LELTGHLGQSELAGQDVLVSRREIELVAGKAIHDFLDLRAFNFTLRAVRKGSQDADAHNRSLFLFGNGLRLD
jgi:hypothetical protein